MNVRIKFSKYGAAKFIGHLDIVRYFQKAFRRSGLEVAYSAGFNPHQLLYFAAPLGLGETSDAEYMDAELLSDYPISEIVSRLNAAMAEGFFIQDAAVLPGWKPNEKKESIMSLTSCADYMLSVKDMDAEQDGVVKPYAAWFSGIREAMAEFLGGGEIIVEKTSKKSTRSVDLKPMIFAWGFSSEEINPGAADPAAGIAHA
ncbi:MAG: TIGR03936 family radical SAM-associated protein, partial [Lachnospiraceae bacterium]|nr:TIGR03936 family radical SAM-associated protein [Lachnospiraceae bacterium]